jgi:hypothetical protein
MWLAHGITGRCIPHVITGWYCMGSFVLISSQIYLYHRQLMSSSSAVYAFTPVKFIKKLFTPATLLNGNISSIDVHGINHRQLLCFKFWAWPIDIKSLQNRLLKDCHVPATSASLPRVSFFFSFLFLLLRPLTVLMKQTRQAVHAVKQYIFLDVYGLTCPPMDLLMSA